MFWLFTYIILPEANPKLNQLSFCKSNLPLCNCSFYQFVNDTNIKIKSFCRKEKLTVQVDLLYKNTKRTILNIKREIG